MINLHGPVVSFWGQVVYITARQILFTNGYLPSMLVRVVGIATADQSIELPLAFSFTNK